MRILFIVFVLITKILANNIIYKGNGNITYYYNIDKNQKDDYCVNGAPELNFKTQCESYTPGKNQINLKDRNSDYIVAIPNYLLNNRKKYCGKKINIIKNGKTINFDKPLFVWDGCERCNKDKGIDLSSYIFKKLSKSKSCFEGILSKIEWNIEDEQIMKFIDQY